MINLVLAAMLTLASHVPLNTIQLTNLGCKAETDILEVVNTHAKFGQLAAVSMWKQKIAEKKCIHTGPRHFPVTPKEVIYTVDVIKENMTIEVYRADLNGKPWFVPTFRKMGPQS
jgi:hypothetical protein